MIDAVGRRVDERIPDEPFHSGFGLENRFLTVQRGELQAVPAVGEAHPVLAGVVEVGEEQHLVVESVHAFDPLPSSSYVTLRNRSFDSLLLPRNENKKGI